MTFATMAPNHLVPGGKLMDRTESTVIQVAPAYENEKIKEMERFGWSLQGRQEMHEEGDAYGRESFSGSSYIITTKVKHYVKLHFVRSVSMKRLPEIKEIETEYNSLPFPTAGISKGPFILAGVGNLAIVGGLAGNPSAGGFFSPVLLLLLPAGIWFFFQMQRSQKNGGIRAQSARRRDELFSQLSALTA